MQRRIEDPPAERRFTMIVLIIFSATALAATSGEILRLILREGRMLALIGAAALAGSGGFRSALTIAFIGA